MAEDHGQAQGVTYLPGMDHDVSARPAGFEPVISAFGARRLLAKYVNSLRRMRINQHDASETAPHYPEIIRTSLGPAKLLMLQFIRELAHLREANPDF
jgi:hypothetical protein